MSAALDPRLIEKEIVRIRERESNPYSSGTKTNLFTLLIFRGAPTDGDDPVETTLQYLLGRRPARIITIQRSSADHTEASVSGRCYPDKRNRGVCFEEVRIDAGTDGLGSDPGAWMPIVLRDLPVFAWLPDADVAPWEPTLRQAAGLVDKLVVDSSRLRLGDSVTETIAVLRELRRKTADIPLLADFAWRRGHVLREQSARAFDPPDIRPLLDRVTRVRLFGGSTAEAALFFRWLEVRLGRALAVEHAAVGPLTEGFKVDFFAGGKDPIEIGCTRGGCLSRGEEKGAYRFPTDGEILLAEVDSLARDTVFQEVLADG
ncbi:MAG TPA: glucose-6-phosphate dehydrogenase assembly protein OpcA [Spirochaetia bacterium]